MTGTQFYMNITWYSADGFKNKLMTGDIKYNDVTVQLEDYATNIQVTFGTRQGGPVYAVDRNRCDREWARHEGNCIIENFNYADGFDVSKEFVLKGNFQYGYVDEVKDFRR